MKRIVRLLPLLLAGVLGCGPVFYEIHGKVTLDGTAVPDAQVQFISSDETQGPAFARADQAGRYRVLLRTGDYTVRILAQKSVPPPPGTPGPNGKPLEAWTIDVIPRKYNAESELRATVTGKGEVDFKLTTDAAP